MSGTSRDAIRIREATEADIPFLMSTERETATAAHWSEEQYRQIFTADPPQRLSLVIEESQQAVGFAVVRVTPTEWEIENIVIHSAARRRGLGSRLLQEVITLARMNGIERLLLEVRASNMDARGLYKTCGFRQSGSRTNYYANPQEDALLFEVSTIQQP